MRTLFEGWPSKLLAPFSFHKHRHVTVKCVFLLPRLATSHKAAITEQKLHRNVNISVPNLAVNRRLVFFFVNSKYKNCISKLKLYLQKNKSIKFIKEMIWWNLLWTINIEVSLLIIRKWFDFIGCMIWNFDVQIQIKLIFTSCVNVNKQFY